MNKKIIYTMLSLGLLNYSNINNKQKNERKFDLPQINIILSNDELAKIDYNSSDLVSDLKNKIQDKKGIPPNQQILIFADKELEDDKTLSYYNIKKGVNINLEVETLLEDKELNLYFDFDSAELSLLMRAKLKNFIKNFIKKNGKDKDIIIEGHTDKRGTREYNLALGEKRAENVYNYLASVGYPKRLMRYISYGEEKPINYESNEEAWAINRRVTITEY